MAVSMTDTFMIISDGKKLALVSDRYSMVMETAFLQQATFRDETIVTDIGYDAAGYIACVPGPRAYSLSVDFKSSGKVWSVPGPVSLEDLKMGEMTILELLEMIERKIEQRSNQEGE